MTLPTIEPTKPGSRPLEKREKGLAEAIGSRLIPIKSRATDVPTPHPVPLRVMRREEG